MSYKSLMSLILDKNKELMTSAKWRFVRNHVVAAQCVHSTRSFALSAQTTVCIARKQTMISASFADLCLQIATSII